jgi:cytochrome o ubiquinol oxidase subunit 1
MFGLLTLNAFVHGPIETGGQLGVVFGGLIVVALLTYFKRWRWLFGEWLSSLDHKKIGIMYICVSMLMLARGFSDALLLRGQQAVAVGQGSGYLPPDHFAQIFTAHGVIMIFFVAMPFMFGFLNLIVPLQIGARDVAYPFLNNISLWLTAAGAMLINLSLVVGSFAATGWLAYPPLSELQYSPGVGVDYYIWALQIAGIGTLLSGINFLVTIIKMRAPGMQLRAMPIFTWTAFGSMSLVVFAFPILTATLAMLSLDRYLGMHFFTTNLGGNAMLYVNLIWAWGHPEVYILVLPAFGIFSEIVPVFSQKRLFGYTSMVVATMAIVFLSFLVWVHHFFTMGAGADVNAFFGIMTAVISIPTGVKIFNWLFTMFRGRIIFNSPMLWFMGFLVTFTIGGMAGVLLSIPGADFQLHNSLFLVAHFHTMIIGGVLFNFFAAFTYWFPKVFGFTLNEKLGKWAFWLWIVGFSTAFIPLYVLGFMGATRRLDYVDATSGWHILFIVAAIGACIIAAALLVQTIQIIEGVYNRKHYKVGSDPWNGRTLEWATHSPPPVYNFAIIPHVAGRDAFWMQKEALAKGHVAPTPIYEDIEMPKNTLVGVTIAAAAFVVGFACVWHIWWLAGAGLVAILAGVIARSFDEDIEYVITAAEVAKIEKSYTV